jgi:UDP-N-acetylmuramoyl-tripeptide--D-alanyl-D-alanine ligase
MQYQRLKEDKMHPFLNCGDIAVATGGLILNGYSKSFSGISIDSRTITKEELFIALKGEKHDGHDFVEEALNKGDGAVISKDRRQLTERGFNGKTFIIVEDTLKALHELASYTRIRFHGKVFAVVGSNGKTTTKELLSSTLATKWDVLKTTGNYNNHIGMPLCLCRLTDNNQVMVLEMGTNRPGDIQNLCNIALPDTAVITNIGYEHIEGFGSLEKVRDSELEILPYVQAIVINADDQFLKDGISSRYNGRIVTFGIQSTYVDVAARDLDCQEDYTGFSLVAGGSSIYIKSNLIGLFNVYNCLAAAAAAISAGLDLNDIKRGIESFSGVRLRFEIKRYRGITFLNDAYNANPSSMEASVNEMMRFMRSRKNSHKRAIVVLGDMLELGDYSITAHQNLGKMLSTFPVDVFIGVGEMMGKALPFFGRKGLTALNSEEAGEKLRDIIKEGDIVLIKGSRGMKMEKVLNSIERFA